MPRLNRLAPLALVLTSGLALATGVPPTPELRFYDDGCEQVSSVQAELRISYDLVSGVCAPRPDGDPCSWSVDEHLDPRELSVRVDGCEAPEKGRFVRARGVSCDGRPIWRWNGELSPGRAHYVGVDGGHSRGAVTVSGEQQPLSCPDPGPVTTLPPGPVTEGGVGAMRDLSFSEGSFTLVEEGDAVRIHWVPDASLAHWAANGLAEGLMSEPMPREAAVEALAQNERNPAGLKTWYQSTGSRQHSEGTVQRGIVRCQRVIERDLEMTLRPSGVVLRGVSAQRVDVLAEECAAPE